MQNGYYQATGAMVTQFNKLDIISNNLANINTPGFKKDSVVVGDFERIFQTFRDEMPLRNHTKESAKFLNRSLNKIPHIVEKFIDFSSGAIKHTGNMLDIALKNGNYFYLVDTPNGVRLTQNGSFILNENGAISTKEGYTLLANDFLNSNNREIKIPQNSTIKIDKSGNIYANDELIAKIFIASVNNLKELYKEGDNLLNMDNIEDNIIQMGEGDYVKQGYLQMSNVNPIKEMVSLIEVNRFIQMYQKVMISHTDDLNKEAITKLASVRA